MYNSERASKTSVSLETIVDKRFLNTVTGEFEALPDGMNIEPDPELVQKIEGSDYYVRLPNQYDIHEYRNMKLRVLQWQMKSSGDPAETLKNVEAACRRAKEAGAELLALPEMFCCPYETEQFPVYAEKEGGDRYRACASLAKKYGIYLSAGSMPERGADGRVYNTAYVFDREGKRIAKHRKMHLFDIDVAGGQSFHESDMLSAGDEVTVFDTEFGKMGLCVCYDFRFPELGRLLALRGAKLILVPAAFNLTTGPMHWELMFRAQAMFNQAFAIGTAPARDPAASYQSWGHSIAVDPWGIVLAQMGEGKGEQLVDIDLTETERVRGQIPLLRHRRADVYSLTSPDQ